MIDICLEYSHTLWSTRCTKVNSSDTIRESTCRQRLIQFYNELKDDPSPIGASSSLLRRSITTSTSRTNQLYNFFGKQKSIKQSVNKNSPSQRVERYSLTYIINLNYKNVQKIQAEENLTVAFIYVISVPTKMQAEIIIFNQKLKLIYSLTYVRSISKSPSISSTLSKQNSEWTWHPKYLGNSYSRAKM